MKLSLMFAAFAASLTFYACTPEEVPQPKRFLLIKSESSKNGAIQSTLTYSYNADQTASGISMKSASDSNKFAFTWQNGRITEYAATYKNNPAILSKLEYTAQLHTKTYSMFIPTPLTLDSIVYNASGKVEIIYIKDLQGDGHWQTLYLDKFEWTGNNITTQHNYALKHNGDTLFHSIKHYTYGNQANLQARLPHVPALWLYNRSSTGVSENLVTGVTSTENGVVSISASGTCTYTFDDNHLPLQRTFTSKDGQKTITNYTYGAY